MKYSLLSVFLFSFLAAFSQNIPANEGGIRCGADAAYFASLTKGGSWHHKTTSTFTSLASFPSYAIVDCGKFRLYYEDLITSNPQEGFSDVTLGAIRRNNLCNVLTYIQSVFDFSSIPSGNPIRIHVSESYAALNPLPVGYGFLARGGPYHPAGPGITNGFVFDFTNTGVDPNPGDYHGDLVVNYGGYTWYPSGTSYVMHSFTFQDNDAAPFVNCRIDLNRTLLHEMGHILGFLSFINYVGGFPGSVAGGNLFSGMDYNIMKGNVFPGYSLSKLVLGTTASPYINPLYATDTNALNRNDLWLNNLTASDNHPVFSESRNFIGSDLMGSLVSHLEDNGWAYSNQQRHSPGYHPRYIMAPTAILGDKSRQYTKGEIQNFHNLGYNLASAYMSTSGATITNHTPYSKKMARYNYNLYNLDFAETLPADYTMTNNIGSSITINLLTDTTVTDADGDPISVMPGSLFNLRGCGNGGNNHNLLTLGSGGSSITYTPRPNFYGRAQFGFNLWDGKEKGSYVIYTIDVAKGTAVSTPPGSNLVLNGGFEEGSEVKLLATAENIPNTTFFMDGHWTNLLSQDFSDAQPYSFYAAPYIDYSNISSLIKNSNISCTGTTYTEFAGGGGYGSFPETWPAYHPMSIDSSDRYKMFWGYGYSYFYLGDSARHCHKYTVEFDYFDGDTSSIVPGSALTFTFGFVNAPFDVTPSIAGPAAIPFVYSFDKSITVDTVWHHATIHFTYCADTSSAIFCLRALSTGCMLMENLSLIEDTTITPLVVSITDTITGLSNRLTASINNIGCGYTYLWNTGATTPAITVTATTAPVTYTVTATDGCGSTSQTITIANFALGTPGENPAKFAIYPNPAGKSFIISGSFAINSNLQVQITDMSGRAVGSKHLLYNGSPMEIQTDLPNGVYIVKLTDAAGNKDQQRLVICK